jgi:short-subunit dehydrogenase
MQTKNRVVILTGATQGIGRATAHRLAGCKLALAARSPVPLQQLANQLNIVGQPAVAIPTDMGDSAQAMALVQKTIAIFGRIDVIINNAGIGIYGPVADLNEVEARRVMDVNYFGPVSLIQSAIPHLKANPDGGLIINVSSIIGRRAMPGAAGYCATKGALERMAESLRLELKADNIRVSTVYPGVTATDFLTNSAGNHPPRQGRRMQGVSPDKVAQTILKAIRSEKRDLFVTPFDHLFVTVSMFMPTLMDWMLRQYIKTVST